MNKIPLIAAAVLASTLAAAPAHASDFSVATMTYCSKGSVVKLSASESYGKLAVTLNVNGSAAGAIGPPALLRISPGSMAACRALMAMATSPSTPSPLTRRAPTTSVRALSTGAPARSAPPPSRSEPPGTRADDLAPLPSAAPSRTSTTAAPKATAPEPTPVRPECAPRGDRANHSDRFAPADSLWFRRTGRGPATRPLPDRRAVQKKRAVADLPQQP